MFENFEKELYCQVGGDNLSYIHVYHDFVWKDIIGHDKAAFRHGKSLTQRVKKDCPEGKTPALILTARDDAEDGIAIETDKFYAPVIKIQQYLKNTKSDFSATYLATSNHVRLTNAGKVKHILNDPSLLTEVLEQGLTISEIEKWASGGVGRWLQLQSLLKSNNIEISSVGPTNSETLIRNLKWLSENNDYDSVMSIVSQIDNDEFRKLQSIKGIAHFRNILKIWEDNKKNNVEEFWQGVFTERPEIISQVFSYPVVILQDKAYLGGKLISNSGGKISDYLYQNKSTRNVMIVEIKTPTTPLLSSEYRQNIYPVSQDLSGSVNQTLIYMNTLLKQYYSLIGEQEDRWEANNPRCLLIIGSLENEDIKGDKKRSFETFRNDLRNIDIITFNELFEKIRLLLTLLEKPYIK